MPDENEPNIVEQLGITTAVFCVDILCGSFDLELGASIDDLPESGLSRNFERAAVGCSAAASVVCLHVVITLSVMIEDRNA